MAFWLYTMSEQLINTVFRPHTRNLLGIRFGNLLVVSFSHYTNGNKAFWNCICDCSKNITISSVSLIQYNKNSCGCKKDVKSNSPIIHGLTKTRIFKIRIGMIQRCYNPKAEKYENYGGRGIYVCDRWLESIENFFEDMGHPTSDFHTLERRNNDDGYYKENCYWATKKEQQQNKRDTIYLNINGEVGTVLQWSAISGTLPQTIKTRYFRGYSHYECVYGKNKPQLN